MSKFGTLLLVVGWFAWWLEFSDLRYGTHHLPGAEWWHLAIMPVYTVLFAAVEMALWIQRKGGEA